MPEEQLYLSHIGVKNLTPNYHMENIRILAKDVPNKIARQSKLQFPLPADGTSTLNSMQNKSKLKPIVHHVNYSNKFDDPGLEDEPIFPELKLLFNKTEDPVSEVKPIVQNMKVYLNKTVEPEVDQPIVPKSEFYVDKTDETKLEVKTVVPEIEVFFNETVAPESNIKQQSQSLNCI